MSAKYAGTSSLKKIREEQIVKISWRYPGVWNRLEGVSSEEMALLPSRNQDIFKVRKIKKKDIERMGINFLGIFIFFYVDGAAEILLTTHGKGTIENEETLKKNKQFLTSLGLEEGDIPYIFYLKGLRVPKKEAKEEKATASYSEMFSILSSLMSSLEE